MRPLIIHHLRYGGQFPHKGKKCVKIKPSYDRENAKWIPINGRPVVIATTISCSDDYLPAHCVPKNVVSNLPKHRVWIGHAGGGPFVWLRDLPEEGIVLEADWSHTVHNGPNMYRTVVRYGTRIFAGSTGAAEFPGYVWIPI